MDAATWRTVASFEIPEAIARAVVANPGMHRGAHVSRTTTPDTVILEVKALPSERYRQIALHRRTNGPSLLSKVGAFVHGAPVREFYLRSALEPLEPLHNALILGAGDWLLLKEGDVTYKWLDLPRAWELFQWLSGWIEETDQRHSGARAGGFKSMTEEREWHEMWRSREAEDEDA